MKCLGINGEIYSLTNIIASGAEGHIFAIEDNDSLLAKIYHPKYVDEEKEKKIVYMISHSLNRELLAYVAWPMDALYDGSNKFIGFVMPKLTMDADLNEIYLYPPKGAAEMPYKNKLIIAINICKTVEAIHQSDYIIGDFNPKNIGVDLKTGAVAFMDTDSYHITIDEIANKAFRCKVCLNGYVAPELIERCGQNTYEKASLPTFTNETDNFALAIHIFKLLMNGYTPFNGINHTESISTGSPGVGNMAIERDNYCFKPNNKPQAVAVPPISALPNEIARLFNKAFINGRINPQERPTAFEWKEALEDYEKDLKKCSKNPNHFYKKTLRNCPLCAAEIRYKVQFNHPVNTMGLDNWNISNDFDATKSDLISPSLPDLPESVDEGWD